MSERASERAWCVVDAEGRWCHFNSLGKSHDGMEKGLARPFCGLGYAAWDCVQLWQKGGERVAC